MRSCSSAKVLKVLESAKDQVEIKSLLTDVPFGCDRPLKAAVQLQMPEASVLKIVDILLQYGAADIGPAHGWSAVQLAKTYKLHEVETALKKAGARLEYPSGTFRVPDYVNGGNIQTYHTLMCDAIKLFDITNHSQYGNAEDLQNVLTQISKMPFNNISTLLLAKDLSGKCALEIAGEIRNVSVIKKLTAYYDAHLANVSGAKSQNPTRRNPKSF